MRQGSFFAPTRQPFRPFPALWEAFAGEPAVIEALDRPRGGFAFLDDASRVFATRGKDAARQFILPEADPRLADLPDRA